MIIIITGNGKGKTTSALGTAIRACGWEKRVSIVFFDKGGSHYGEDHILSKVQGMEIFRFGLKRFDEEAKTFRFENLEEDKTEVIKGIKKVLSLLHSFYDLIVCDEIINCLNLDLIDKESVQKLLSDCPKETHLIFTGRNAPDWLIEIADLVSEVKEVKHYFKKGKSAIKGIDY